MSVVTEHSCKLNHLFYSNNFSAGSEGLQCLFLDYRNFFDIMSMNEPILCKLRSIHIYKSVAMMVEESKFEDVTREVVDSILNEPNLKKDIQNNKRRVQRKFEKNFESIIDQGIMQAIKNRGVHTGIDSDLALTSKTRDHVLSFLEAMMPKKSYNALEELRKTKMKSKSRDVLPFIQGIGQKFKNLSMGKMDSLFDKNSDIQIDSQKMREPLKEPEPEIFNSPPDSMDRREKEARGLMNSNRAHKIDHKPILIPKSKKMPHIDEELLMEEGSHHNPMDATIGLNSQGLANYKPHQRFNIDPYDKIFEFKRRQDKRVTINSHTDEIKHNLNKLKDFVDINVPAVMGETYHNPGSILNTLTSGLQGLLPDTVETEVKKTKYDDAFDFFVYKYLEGMQLNQVDPNVKEYEYSSDEDVSPNLKKKSKIDFLDEF